MFCHGTRFTSCWHFVYYRSLTTVLLPPICTMPPKHRQYSPKTRGYVLGLHPNVMKGTEDRHPVHLALLHYRYRENAVGVHPSCARRQRESPYSRCRPRTKEEPQATRCRAISTSICINGPLHLRLCDGTKERVVGDGLWWKAEKGNT